MRQLGNGKVARLQTDHCPSTRLKRRPARRRASAALPRELRDTLADKQDKANKDLMYACREGDTDASAPCLAEGARRREDTRTTTAMPECAVLARLCVACQMRRVEVARFSSMHDSEAALTPLVDHYRGRLRWSKLLSARSGVKAWRDDVTTRRDVFLSFYLIKARDNAMDDWRTCGRDYPKRSRRPGPGARGRIERALLPPGRSPLGHGAKRR